MKKKYKLIYYRVHIQKLREENKFRIITYEVYYYLNVCVICVTAACSMQRLNVERVGDTSRMGTGTERGWAQPFEISPPPPPPPVVSKGFVESGKFNKRATSRQRGGGGGLSRKGVLSSLLYQPF